ncbi:MAG: hypothetical protein ABW137_28390 [Mycobacterium sp.]
MTGDAEPTAPERAASGHEEDPHAPNLVRDVANRFARTYDLTQVDPHFAQLFAPTVEVWHNFDQDVMRLAGEELASAMLRMLHATSDIVQGHSDRIWSLQIGHDGFTLAATASGELNGCPLHIARCLLVTVHEGRIARIYEFGDRQQRAPLDEALRAADKFRT